MKRVLLIALFLSSACSGMSTRKSALVAGTYQSREGATIQVQGDRVVIVRNGRRAEHALIEVASERWPRGCRTGGAGLGVGGSIAVMETKQFDEESYIVAQCPGPRIYVTSAEDLACRSPKCQRFERVPFTNTKSPSTASADRPQQKSVGTWKWIQESELPTPKLHLDRIDAILSIPSGKAMGDDEVRPATNTLFEGLPAIGTTGQDDKPRFALLRIYENDGADSPASFLLGLKLEIYQWGAKAPTLVSQQELVVRADDGTVKLSTTRQNIENANKQLAEFKPLQPQPSLPNFIEYLPEPRRPMVADPQSLPVHMRNGSVDAKRCTPIPRSKPRVYATRTHPYVVLIYRGTTPDFCSEYWDPSVRIHKMLMH